MVKPCCLRPENLVVTDTRTTPTEDVEVCRVCRVCGCRHFDVSVSPVRVGVTGG